MRKDKPGEDVLQAMYLGKGMTSTEIAGIYGVPSPTVRKWLQDAGIRRPGKTEEERREEERLLRELYVKEKKSAGELAELFGVNEGCMRGRLKRYGITKPPLVPLEARPGEEELRRLYIEEKLTVVQIASECGIPARMVRTLLFQYGAKKDPATPRGGKREKKCPGGEALASLVEEGKNKGEIAAMYDVCLGTVDGWFFKYGIQADAARKASGEMMKKMFLDEGMTMSQIAEKCGVCLATVRKRLREAGVPPLPPGRCKDSQRASRKGKCRPAGASHGKCPFGEDELRRMYLKEGMGAKEIAAEGGVSATTISRRLSEYGIRKDAWDACPGKEELGRMYIKEKMPVSAIAKALGVPEGRVGYWIRKLGLSRKGQQAKEPADVDKEQL